MRSRTGVFERGTRLRATAPKPSPIEQQCAGCEAKFSSVALSPTCESCWKLLPREMRQEFLKRRKTLDDNRSGAPARVRGKMDRLASMADLMGQCLELIKAWRSAPLTATAATEVSP